MRLKIAIALTALASAHAGVIYNEAISGDLANSGLTPTGVTVTLGSNQILGTTGGTDRDYFTFSVPAGLQSLQTRYIQRD